MAVRKKTFSGGQIRIDTSLTGHDSSHNQSVQNQLLSDVWTVKISITLLKVQTV